MGSSDSKEFQPLEVFNDLIDFTVALKCVAANMVSKVIDVSAVPLSPADRKEFDALERRKLDVLREIRKFVSFINMQVLAIKMKIDSKDLTPDPVPFLDMKYGKSRAPVGDVLAEYSKTCSDLAEEYKTFGTRLEEKHVVDNNTKKIVGGILIAAGVLGAAALIFFSAGTATPLVIGVGTAGAAVGALGAVVVGAIMVSPSEVERATAYLKKVAGDLNKISLGLDRIIPYYEPDNHLPLIKSLDFVLNLTNDVIVGIEKAIEARYA